MKKRIIALILACVMVFAFAACGDTNTDTKTDTKTETKTDTKTDNSTTEPKKDSSGEKVITVANTLSMGDLDPFAASSGSRNAMRYSTYEYLAVFTEFGQSWEQMDKELAKEITKIDDVTYEVEIYDYIVDAIGNPITADDVAWSWNTLDESAMYNRVTSTLEICEAIEPYKVRITLSSPIVGGIEYLLAQCNVVSQKTYEENKAQFSTKPITTAAYQITECVDGSYYTMEKNANYWQKDESLRGKYCQQPVDKFVIQILTEAQQVATALEQGNVDVVTNLKTSIIDNFMNADGTAKDGYSVKEFMETTGIMLGYNMSEGSVLADNVALRKAIAYGIDSNAIVNGAMKGHAIRLYDVSIPGCADSNPEWLNENYFDYDADLAAQLLEEAGYPGGKDSSGKALHLVLMCESSREQSAIVAQATLMQLGLDIELKAVDDAMMSSYQTDPTQWDLMISKCGVDYTCLGAYNTELAQDKNGVARRSFFKDDEFNTRLKEAQTVSGNTAENVEWIHDYVAENCYKVGLYTGMAASAAKAGIELFVHPWGQLVWTACDYSNYFA